MFVKQDNVISDKNRFASKWSTSAIEYAPKRMEEDSEENDSKVNYDAWIKPKKCMPITYFFKKSKNKDEFEDDNNKCNMLIDDDENNVDEEDEMNENKRQK